VALGELVEDREQLVQELDDGLGRDSLAEGGEVDDVGEQHGDLGEPGGNHALGLFEPGGDGCREDVQQQPLGSLPFHIQRRSGPDRLSQ